jgi:hypothetical protein
MGAEYLQFLKLVAKPSLTLEFVAHVMLLGISGISAALIGFRIADATGAVIAVILGTVLFLYANGFLNAFLFLSF